MSVEFVDEVTVHVRGGDGGNGVVSTRREKHVPRGGPDGGDGGQGGDVVFVGATDVTSLLDLHRAPHQRGENGRHGEGDNRKGADGDDQVIRVPLGTVVRDRDSGVVLADIVRPGQRYIAARGGRGGRGNAAFANRYRRVPRFAEFGEQAKERSLRLELKVIADVGLVGYPSAGKSSLISRLSAAKPRVEAWPFTTLTPHLGVMRAGDRSDREGGHPIDVVLADVPGLIEGASEGKGLGHRFLRHIERCLVLLHVLDAFPFEPERDPVRDLDVIRRELGQHDPALLERVEVVALNKVDLPDGQAMADVVRADLEARGYEVFEVSAVSGAGLDALRFRLGELVEEARSAFGDVIAEEVAPEEVVIRLESTGPDFTVGRSPSGSFQVTGARIERWVQMLPLDNREAVRYLQGRLRRAGVERALIDAGAREGDEVQLGAVTFEFTPDIDDLPAEEREAILAGELADELGEVDDGDEDLWDEDEV